MSITTLNNLADNVPLKAGTGISIAVQGSKIVMSAEVDNTNLKNAVLERLLGTAESPSPIMKINGVSPSERGTLFLLGSACDNVDVDGTTKEIRITDVCPACTSCEATVEARKSVESLVVIYNLLKDTQLYTAETAAIRTKILQDRGFYISESEQGSSAGTITAEDAVTSLAALEGLTADELDIILQNADVLRRYIATVNMWNYAVQHANNATRIVAAPEDASGFSVQTRLARTTCKLGDDEGEYVYCFIELAPEAVQENLSVYVPGTETSFEYKELVGADWPTAEAEVEHSSTDVCRKVVKSWFNLKRPATCMVSQTFLPFFNVEATYKNYNPADGNNRVDLRELLTVYTPTSVAPTQDTSGTAYYDLAFKIAPVTNPTSSQYNNGKICISGSATTTTTESGQEVDIPAVNRWSVRILWGVCDSEAEIPSSYDAAVTKGYISNETYMYTSMGCRVPLSDILGDTTIEPESTS